MTAMAVAGGGNSQERCRKRWYPSRAVAKKALRRHHDRGHSFAGCRPYRCDVCDGWHLGHLPARIIAGRTSRRAVFG